MFPPEDVYGYRKCLGFLSEAVANVRPARVLDVGCGTGEKLTWPLAQAHPDVRFVGADADVSSIARAREACIAPNLEFLQLAQLRSDDRFGVIVASEVIEHVEAPIAFLRDLSSRLAPGGQIVLTVPNGNGPSELASLLETVLALTGILGVARAVKRAIWRRGAGSTMARDTLAVSPHINFFTWTALHRIFAVAGFSVRRYRARTLFCGLGFDLLIQTDRTAQWNADVADRVWPRCVSGWMFVLEPVSEATVGVFRRGALSRARRWLNEKRWGLRPADPP